MTLFAGTEAKKLLKKKFSNKDARRLGNSGTGSSWAGSMRCKSSPHDLGKAASKVLRAGHVVTTRREAWCGAAFPTVMMFPCGCRAPGPGL